MPAIDLSIIFPAYLEEENLRVILPRLKHALSALQTRHEILVIDTMQKMDNTREVCDEHGAKYINRENGDSYGDAVRTGIKHAQGEWTVFMDADGSHSPEFIGELYKYRNEYDIVIASRYVKGGGSDNDKLSIFMSLMVNKIFSVILNLGCKDVSNSFKLYRTELIRHISLKSNNFDIIEEMLVKLKRKNKTLRIKEVPFFFKERMFGHTKRNLVAFIFSYLTILIKLKFFSGYE